MLGLNNGLYMVIDPVEKAKEMQLLDLIYFIV